MERMGTEHGDCLVREWSQWGGPGVFGERSPNPEGIGLGFRIRRKEGGRIIRNPQLWNAMLCHNLGGISSEWAYKAISVGDRAIGWLESQSNKLTWEGPEKLDGQLGRRSL